MAEQHRATADGWALVERMRHQLEFSTILELRDRIEALEAARANHPAKPDSSLVERVALTLAGPHDDAELWMLDARAAIREVAAWLDTVQKFDAAVLLRLETER